MNAIKLSKTQEHLLHNLACGKVIHRFWLSDFRAHWQQRTVNKLIAVGLATQVNETDIAVTSHGKAWHDENIGHDYNAWISGIDDLIRTDYPGHCYTPQPDILSMFQLWQADMGSIAAVNVYAHETKLVGWRAQYFIHSEPGYLAQN